MATVGKPINGVDENTMTFERGENALASDHMTHHALLPDVKIPNVQIEEKQLTREETLNELREILETYKQICSGDKEIGRVARAITLLKQL